MTPCVSEAKVKKAASFHKQALQRRPGVPTHGDRPLGRARARWVKRRSNRKAGRQQGMRRRGRGGDVCRENDGNGREGARKTPGSRGPNADAGTRDETSLQARRVVVEN